jgi:hypothetical protein
MIDTTPKAITPAIRTFCLSIAPVRPAFVRCRPDKDAKPSECFDNVARKVDRAGGAAVTGWAIWNVPRLYLEAEHHGVWCNRQGELVDVTPQPNRPKRMLFLRDDAATYDPASFRSNVIHPASDDPLAIEFVELAKRRNAVQDAYREGGNRLALFTISDQRELGHISQRLQQIWKQVVG